MTRAFPFSAYRGIDGAILVTNDGRRVATKQDMEWFWDHAEPYLDMLTLKLAADMRGRGERIEPWLKKAELESFKRTRERKSGKD